MLVLDRAGPFEYEYHFIEYEYEYDRSMINVGNDKALRAWGVLKLECSLERRERTLGYTGWSGPVRVEIEHDDGVEVGVRRRIPASQRSTRLNRVPRVR